MVLTVNEKYRERSESVSGYSVPVHAKIPYERRQEKCYDHPKISPEKFFNAKNDWEAQITQNEKSRLPIFY